MPTPTIVSVHRITEYVSLVYTKKLRNVSYNPGKNSRSRREHYLRKVVYGDGFIPLPNRIRQPTELKSLKQRLKIKVSTINKIIQNMTNNLGT